jgi:hypothetical protein
VDRCAVSREENALKQNLEHDARFNLNASCSNTKGRKERALVPFSNFRAIKRMAEIRELNQRSFLMTVV